jgi:DNA-directed RNA polymerase subunit M/transcription elongation factor TFIIS
LALTGFEKLVNFPNCPNCGSNKAVREILYGLPEGPVDESKYAIGGCCVSESDPSLRCTTCGWEGEFKNQLPYQEKTVHMVELKSTVNMSDAERDEYAKTLWRKLTNNGKGWDDGDSKS